MERIGVGRMSAERRSAWRMTRARARTHDREGQILLPVVEYHAADGTERDPEGLENGEDRHDIGKLEGHVEVESLRHRRIGSIDRS